MKRTKFLMGFLLLLLSIQGFSQSPGDSLYDNSFVHNIEITFYETNYWDTLEVHYNSIFDSLGVPVGEKKYLPAQIIIDGNILDTVGVRQKGFLSNFATSFTAAPTKKPFKVDINEFVKGQKYDGLKKFSLNNGFEDPSMMRELVSLELMRNAGIKAPRTSYANVYLNGIHWGFYIIMEQVDKTFLKENFSNGNGNLYKSISNTTLSWQGPAYTSYTGEMELKTNEDVNDWSDFMRFINIINKQGYNAADYLDSLHTIFNVDDYMKVLSIDVLTGNWDSYYDHGRNFYIYHNPDDDKFHWIPWDYNLAFADLGTDILFQNVAPPFNGGSRVLIDNMLAEPSLKTKYFDTYCNMLAFNFTSARLDPIIDSAKAVIETDRSASTNEFFTAAEFIQNITGTVQGQGFGGSYVGIKPFITTRTTEVNNELNQLNHSCNTSFILAGDVVINEFKAENDSTDNIVDQDGEYDDWIELYNNTSDIIDLTGYYLTDDFGNITQWTIPDTTIEANGYLIIWADKDDTQSGLHADFKLSKSGEQIMLSAPNGDVIDSVSYGAQQLSTSYARLPNGTGSFFLNQVTFNGFNSGVNTRSVVQSDVKLYPNPVRNELTIELKEENNVEMIRLVNVTGQTMLEKSITNIDDKVFLNVASMSTGMYFLVFQTKTQQTFSKKLMIID